MVRARLVCVQCILHPPSPRPSTLPCPPPPQLRHPPVRCPQDFQVWAQAHGLPDPRGHRGRLHRQGWRAAHRRPPLPPPLPHRHHACRAAGARVPACRRRRAGAGGRASVCAVLHVTEVQGKRLLLARRPPCPHVLPEPACPYRRWRKLSASSPLRMCWRSCSRRAFHFTSLLSFLAAGFGSGGDCCWCCSGSGPCLLSLLALCWFAGNRLSQ